MSSSPFFKLYVLGEFRLERSGIPLDLPTRKIESLFAYLALHPQEHAREKLAAMFWGDSTDQSARHSLSVALNTLRKSLDPTPVLADRATVQLSPDFPMWVDAHEMDDLQFLISDLNTPHDEQISNIESIVENYGGD